VFLFIHYVVFAVGLPNVLPGLLVFEVDKIADELAKGEYVFVHSLVEVVVFF